MPNELPTVPPVPILSPPEASPTSPEPVVEPTPAEPAPAPVEPVAYEILRQDANVGGGRGSGAQPETPVYLVPELERNGLAAALPVDLSALLADQQMNAAAGGSSAPSATECGSQQRRALTETSRQQPMDTLHSTAARESNTQPPSTPPIYENTIGTNLPESLPASEESGQLGRDADRPVSGSIAAAFPETGAEAAADTPAAAWVILRQYSATGPSRRSSSGAQAFRARLPSYEESMSSSDAASVSLSPLGSPLLPVDETTANGNPAAALPGYDASPPAYVSDKLLELNANTPLKLQQVQLLQSEMTSAAGVGVHLDKTQCDQALALVDYFDRVW